MVVGINFAQSREKLLLESLGTKLGVNLTGYEGNGGQNQSEWQACELLIRCGPQLSHTSEIYQGNVQSKNCPVPSTIVEPSAVVKVSCADSRKAIGLSEGSGMCSISHSQPTSAPLDPVQRHVCTAVSTGWAEPSTPRSKSNSADAAAAGPGVLIGPEWQLVKMVRERLPVDLLQRVPPEADHDAVWLILEKLLDLVASRLKVKKTSAVLCLQI